MDIIARTERFATDILQNQLSDDLTYHNYEHTLTVVQGARTIGQAEGLNDADLEVVVLAAWLHDIGHSKVQQGHEERSRQMAEEFLRAENVAEEVVARVGAAIMVTEMGTAPSNPLEEVMCDADMCHIAGKDYDLHADRLRQEWALVEGKTYTDLQWLNLNLDFLAVHRFYTDYGKTVLRKGKEKAIRKIRKKAKKLQASMDAGLERELGVTADELKAMKKKLKKVEGRPERGIETMFRLTSKNHLTLSSMADSKANIMISVNSIIVSILIVALFQRFDDSPHLIAPTLILLLVNLGSIVFSVLSIRPTVTKGLFTREDIEKHRTNLLFFGNFHKMKRDDYHWGMNQLMDNATFLYTNLIDDIYFLGVVLAKKYRFLRISYDIFMYGIVVAVLAFVVATVFFAPSF